MLINKKSLERLKEIEEDSLGNRRVITLRAVLKTSAYKGGGKVTVQPRKNPSIPGRYLGIEPLSEYEKQKRAVVVTEDTELILVDGIEFDLSNEEDSLTWEWVKHLAVVEITRDECQSSGSDGLFYIEQEDYEESEYLKATRVKLELSGLIMQDPEDMLYSRAELVGLSMTGQSPDAIRAVMLRMVETNPLAIKNAYKDENAKQKIFINDAISKGVIVKDLDTGFYTYGNITLGTTIDSIVSFLRVKSNKQVANDLYNAVTNLDEK